MTTAMTMQLAHPLDAVPQHSPLAEAREKRDLSVKQVAYRSGLSEDEITWIEDGRLYRFPSQNAAILAALVYATTLGVDRWEARRLAGLPVALAGGLRVNARMRMIVLAAVASLLSAVGVMVFVPNLHVTRTRTVEAIPNANLPPPWKLEVDVLNGSGDISWTRSVASEVGAMGYTISHVGRAERFNYKESAVFYGPGGRAVGLRLARQLKVAAKQMPGAKPTQLLVIVGPHRGPG
jgi:transcriptional regulator with XRE-family HTH domain